MTRLLELGRDPVTRFETDGFLSTEIADSSGNVAFLNYGPVIEGLDVYLDYAISMMLYALNEAASHFKIEVIPEIEALQRVNREVAGPALQGRAQ